ncbi:hypothetical protein AB0424_02070 [Streptomyces sp. NPDC051180]|uniref:hypothetical protein n=1 Tax=Streptomyces sp. NPDC051180 TaxID=3155797 RepID=UPI003450842E
MPGSLVPAGPIFGPDPLVIDVGAAGAGGPSLGVPIRPDALNAELAAAGLPARYYFQPPRVTVAPRLGSPDLDFSATVMVEAPVGPHPTYLGGSCTFSCTAALPGGAEARLVEALTQRNHAEPPARIAPLFVHGQGAPTPELLMVPVTGSAVSCVIEEPPGGAAPLVMSVQGGPGGGVDVQSRSSFLVSFSPEAAESVVTSLRDAAAPPFVIRNVLTEQFDTGAASITADVDVALDKLHAVLAGAVSPGEPWPGGEAAATAYRAAVATGAVRINLTETDTGTLLNPTGSSGHTDSTDSTGGPGTSGPSRPSDLSDPAVVAWLADTDEIRKAVFLLSKDPLFDVATGTLPPDAPPRWWTEVFGDARVTLKTAPMTAGIRLQQVLVLHGTVTAEQTIEGSLTEVAEAARTRLETYLAVIAI